MRKYVLLILGLSFASCEKEPEFSAWNQTMDDMYDCHTQEALDSAELAKALIGTWDWRFVRSTSWSYYESEEDFAGFALTVHEDGTFDMNQNDTLTVSGTWALENSWTTFTLNSQPYVPTLWGNLLFCEPYLMFYSSPADGPDNLYEKR
jgi:hypothetical protein